MRTPKTSPKKRETPKEPYAQIIKNIGLSEGIISAIGDGIRILDRAYMVLYENQVHKNMMGDHTGEYCYRAYKKQETVCSGCPVERVLEDGRINTVQRELQTDKGAWYLDITASPLKDHTGETVAVIEIIRDITQRKQAEIAMRETQRKLENIIEHSNELYYLHDTRHVLTYASPQSLQILGYTPEEMMIEWTRLATDNPMNEQGIKITERALKTGKRQPPYFLELFKKDRSIVLLEIDESPLKDDKGNVIGIVGAARDITERKKAEEQMKRSKQELRERIKELEEFYHMAVGRELRMKQLKEENEELKEELRKKREA